MTALAFEAAASAWESPVPEWRDIARPEQLPPPGQWLIWAFIAGRGAGKTRSAAEWVNEQALANPGCRIALVGRTPADVRDVMIEGDSGILTVARADRPVYQPTKRRLTWPNGSMAYTYSAEVPAQLRGPQHGFAWADEAASWTDARKGDVLDTAWNNLMLGLRLGESPRCAVTTTPKPNALTRSILGRKSTVVTRGTTYDNLDNLAPSFREEVLSSYEGTRIGRQELLGELLEDVDGALWTVALIDANRVASAPDLRRVVVAVDPSGGSGPHSDEQGIIVAGVGVDGHVYILADRSCKLSPHGWASRAVAAYREFGADRVVAERNFGGDMVASTIGQVDPNVPVKMVTASRGKVQRAEPVAAAYEQGRVHHVGAFSRLEDQMCVAGGTLVTTLLGDIPVENVHAGDFALTRAGWQPIQWAGFTGIRRTLTIMTDSGSLTCTPNHPIYLAGRGFIRADEVRKSDRIVACQQNPSGLSSTSMAAVITATMTAITRRAGLADAACFTGTSGSPSTGRYLTAGRFTTATMTGEITIPRTSPRYRSPIMSASIRADSGSWMPGSAANAQRLAGRLSSPSRILAWNAAPSSSRPAFAPLSAPAGASVATVLSVRENPVPCAVYNLTVASQPEFYANGLLTHNCTWTPADGTSPDRMDALTWSVTELTDNFGASAWLAWAKRKAEAAESSGAAVSGGAAAPGPDEADAADEPDAVVVPIDPVAARKAARDAAFRAMR